LIIDTHALRAQFRFLVVRRSERRRHPARGNSHDARSMMLTSLRGRGVITISSLHWPPPRNDHLG
jgi:hypothetical protein